MLPKAEETQTQSADLAEKAQETAAGEPTEHTAPPVASPSPGRTHPGRGRPPKSSPLKVLAAQTKAPAGSEEESVVKDVQEFQDDPRDTDYTPS